MKLFLLKLFVKFKRLFRKKSFKKFGDMKIPDLVRLARQEGFRARIAFVDADDTHRVIRESGKDDERHACRYQIRARMSDNHVFVSASNKRPQKTDGYFWWSDYLGWCHYYDGMHLEVFDNGEHHKPQETETENGDKEKH